MNKEEMKLRIIEEIINLSDDNVSPFVDRYLNALYEIIINKDFDYIENLFQTKEDFEEFIEKYKNDCKCGKND